MGYNISKLKSLPKIFNWYMFLLGDYRNNNMVNNLFRNDFPIIAEQLGENAAIIAQNHQLERELSEMLMQVYDYAILKDLEYFEYKCPGLLLIDGQAMESMTQPRHFFPFLHSKQREVVGNICFIPFELMEASYYSSNELLRDLVHFAHGTNNNLLQKTHNTKFQSKTQQMSREFNYHWASSRMRNMDAATTIYATGADLDQSIHADMMTALVNLASNQLYSGYSENQRNDVLREHLRMVWGVRDQTRQGTSESNCDAGEVDILLTDKLHMPIAIIEALCVTSLEKKKIDAHINKALTNYDPLGLPVCSLVIYCSSVQFGDFWSKLMDHLKDYPYPFPMFQSFEENHLSYSSLRHAKAILIRKGQPLCLHVYALHIPKQSA